MDLNRLFGMLTRMFVRSAVNTGLDVATRKGKPDAELTPDQRKQARSAKETARKAQKLARLGRRFLK